MKKTFPTLYHKTAKGAINIWSVWAEGNKVFTRWGQKDGKMQESCKEVTQKNVGRSNETSLEKQAILEAKSLWTYKKERKYSETIKETNKEIFLPMLAKNFDDRKRFLKESDWPAFGQPKLNGCLHGNSVLETNDGKKTIKDIVDKKLKLKVLSFNEKTQKLEYESVSNWFNNGKVSYESWVEIVPQFGPYIKCTKDHLILTKTGWKKAENLNSNKDQILQKNNFRLNALIAGTILGDSFLIIDRRHNGLSYRLSFNHCNKKYFNFKIKLFNLKGKTSKYISGYGSNGLRFNSEALTKTSFPIDIFYHTENNKNKGKRKLIKYKNLKKYITPEALSLWIADDGSLQLNNKNIYTPRLSLATHGHSEEQILEFLKFFQRVWNCNPSVYINKNVKNNKNCSGKGLTFSTKDTLLILNSLRKNHCKGVEYKYYFPTDGYIEKVNHSEFSWTEFKKRNSKYMGKPATKYDIEVNNNHNYLADGIVVHNCRALAYKNKNNSIKLMSRAGKEYFLTHISNELSKTKLGKDEILDGELYIHGLELQDLNTLIRRTKNFNPDSVKVEYHVYDFTNLKMSLPWIERRAMMDSFFETNRSVLKKTKKVNGKKIRNEKEVYSYHSECASKGYEGSIIRLEHGLYKFGYRSSDLLKVKSFKDAEYKIIGFTNGKGKFKTCIVYICETKDKKTFNVVPKGTFEERSQWLKEGKKHIGKMLTVKYQEFSNDNIPLFPVGICIRLDEDMPKSK